MSKFYSEIAKYYDYIFPLSEITLDFIKDKVGTSPKDILDVACGSGQYTQALNDNGYRMVAIDLDEQMIRELQQRNHEVKAEVLNMLEISRLNQKFDLIFCIGNSLVHLNDNQEIYKFFASCFDCLKPDGKLLLQVVNYDRILEKNIKSLSTIEDQQIGLRFERNYDYIKDQHKINFNTVLKVKDESLENNVLLHPIRSKELLELLKQAGFSEVEFFGNFKKEAFQPLESIPLIAIGTKKVAARIV